MQLHSIDLKRVDGGEVALEALLGAGLGYGRHVHLSVAFWTGVAAVAKLLRVSTARSLFQHARVVLWLCEIGKFIALCDWYDRWRNFWR